MAEKAGQLVAMVGMYAKMLKDYPEKYSEYVGMAGEKVSPEKQMAAWKEIKWNPALYNALEQKMGVEKMKEYVHKMLSREAKSG